MNFTDHVISRFHGKVERIKTGCWKWKARLNEHGYGLFVIGHAKAYLAHRIAYEMFRGQIPEGLYILHSCDNRRCVNPEHLRLGTQAENVADMMTRQRNVSIPRFGERNPTAKLTAEAARSIRHEYAAGDVSQCRLAKKYGVSQSAVQLIVTGKTWREAA